MMKKWTGLMLIFLLTLCAAADRFEVKAIQFSSRKTPVPSYENTNSRSKTSAKRRWLCVETLFVPQGVSRGESWYDDVTMEGALVIVRPGKKEASYVVLTGKTRFFTIPADNREHIGMFYVPPMILARYCGDDHGELPMVRMLRVAFYGPGRVLLGEGYWVAPVGGKRGHMLASGDRKAVRAAALRMREFEKGYSNVTTLRGGLYSKEKTPWVHYSYDLYDLIYDNVLQKDSGSIKK